MKLIGVGEGLEDLRPFDARREFADPPRSLQAKPRLAEYVR